MFVVKYYVVLGIAALFIAISIPHWYFSILLVWLSFSLFLVSGAYMFDVAAIFRKRHDGTIPFYISWLFFPFLLGVQIYNSWARKNDKVPAIQEIRPNLYLACRLFPNDVDYLKSNGVGAILDATSEFSGLNWSANDDNLAYRNVPILDHMAPHANDLLEAINWIQNQLDNNKGVVIHCALGRGRSVLIMAAYLVASGTCNNVDDALNYINKIRGTANLNKAQYKKLSKIHSEGKLKLANSMLLIVNPVSGGGRWSEHSKTILDNLSGQFQVKVIETTPAKSAKQIASEQLKQNYKLIVACGGDGTVNEVASQLVNTKQAMAIMPLGTTNALAHVLFGIKSKLDPVGIACDVILDGDLKAIDTATCNNDIVLLLAGLGFEQKMIEDANREEKNEHGQFAYVSALINAINENDLLDLELTIDKQAPIRKRVSSLVIANAAPFSTVLAHGGEAPSIEDGLLDMSLLDTSSEKILPLIGIGANTLLPSWFQSFEIEGLEHSRVSEVKIKSNTPVQYVVDGETRQSKEVNISVNKTSLNVLVPPKQ